MLNPDVERSNKSTEGVCAYNSGLDAGDERETLIGKRIVFGETLKSHGMRDVLSFIFFFYTFAVTI